MQSKDPKPKEDPLPATGNSSTESKKPPASERKNDEAEDAELERKEEQMLDSTDDA